MCYLVIFSGIIGKNTIGRDLAVALMVNNSPANAGDVRDMSSIPGSRRFPGEGHGNHCSILAWRFPRTKEPGGL